MRNIKIVLEYDGARYDGYQRLGKGESTNTIENKLKEVIQKMTLEQIDINAAQRTENGVHALGQVINFKTKSTMTLLDIRHYLNRYLPRDIAVISVEEVDERFHAALNAIEKTYIYKLSLGEYQSVFDRKFAFYVFGSLDIDKMREAASYLEGKHDFRNFSSVKKSKGTVKEIFLIDIYASGNEAQISIRANDFIHNMARMIIGTLLEVGMGKRPASDMNKILDGTLEASAPAEAKAMYLEEVTYK